MAPKLVTIYGATGNQGGSVARALLADKTAAFSVRGITRSPDSERARALASAGAEVVRADGRQREQLVAAFVGSWAVYANTQSDDPEIGLPGGPSETDIGKAIVDAAVEAGVKVFVFSGMESVLKMTGGKMSSINFEEKNAIAEYAKTKPFESVISVSPGMYMENFLMTDLAPVFGGFPALPGDDGVISYVHPRWGGSEEQPMIAIGADYGDLVHGVLLEPGRYNGRLVQGVSESRSAEATAGDFEEATEKKTRFVVLEDVDEFPTYGMKPLETVRDIFKFCQINGGFYYGVPNDVDTAAELKAAAAKAQGKSGEDAKLMTMKRFFETHFAS